MDVTAIAEGVATLKTAFDAFRSAIGLAKDAKGLIPDSGAREALEASLAAAERAAQLAEAQVAQALGYRLCRCTFPPQVMLSISTDSANERYQCPTCKQLWPSAASRQPIEQPRPPWR